MNAPVSFTDNPSNAVRDNAKEARAIMLIWSALNGLSLRDRVVSMVQGQLVDDFVPALITAGVEKQVLHVFSPAAQMEALSALGEPYTIEVKPAEGVTVTIGEHRHTAPTLANALAHALVKRSGAHGRA